MVIKKKKSVIPWQDLDFLSDLPYRVNIRL